MPNVGLTVNVGVAAGNLPFTLPSKRNIGFAVESQRGVPWTVYPDINAFSDYTGYFGGAYNGQYSYYLIKSLFDNTAPNSVPVTMKVFRAVGTGTVAASASGAVQGSNITVAAGWQGQADPGDWGNNISIIFYTYGLQTRNAFTLQVYYLGKLVETWTGPLCASIQSQVNQLSSYITITFSAEVPIGTLTNALTGTITSSTASAIVTGTATTFTSQVKVGSVMYSSAGVMIGTVKSITSDTSLTLTGLSAVAISGGQYKIRLDSATTLPLAAGVYVAPVESQYYPVSDPTNPSGLAIFDGQDVQLIAVTENHTLTMAVQEQSYCQGRTDAIAVLNLPLNSSEAIVQNYANTLQLSDRAYSCSYLEWVQVLDASGAAITIPSLGVVLGAGFLSSPYQQGDFIHIPPAGTDGPYVNVQAVVTGLLSPANITKYVQAYTVNMSTYSKLYGRYLIGSRANTTNALWTSIHTNLQVSYYVRTLLDNMAFMTQKSNSPSLKKRAVGTLDNFFRGEYDNGSLEQALTYDENVSIICDQTNNPLSQDRKIVNITVAYVPPEAVESVVIQLNRNDQVLTATVSPTTNS